MEKIDIINLLYDFYGGLLTDKQRFLMELYYYDDFSLAEISEKMGISRQAVYDSIKRSESSLADYENKLGLVKNYLDKYTILKKALYLLEEKNDYHKVKQLLLQLLEKEAQ